MADFRSEPSAVKRAAIVQTLAAARAGLSAFGHIPSAEMSATLAPRADGSTLLSQDSESLLAAQEAIGYDDQSGLTAKLNAALDDLDSNSIADLDYSDPLGAAFGDAYRLLRIGQYKVAASLSEADRDGFTKAAEHIRAISEQANKAAPAAVRESSSLGAVNAAVELLERLTRHSAGMVEDTTSAAQGLAERTENLARSIDRFQLGEQPASLVAAQVLAFDGAKQPITTAQQDRVTSSGRRAAAA